MSHRRRIASVAIASSALALLSASAALAHGPSWEGDLLEDAKGTASTAQLVSTGGPVMMINGTLGSYPAFMDGSPDVVDMYLIRLEAPAILKISTAGGAFGGSANFDSQLFLFRASGSGDSSKALALLANNDFDPDSSGSRIGPSANDGSGFVVSAPGLYYIAITAFGTNPFTTGGDSIWGVLDVPGQVRFGNQVELAGWNPTGQSPGGAYSISLSGFSGEAVPAPGALALLGLGGLARGLRRRR